MAEQGPIDRLKTLPLAEALALYDRLVYDADRADDTTTREFVTRTITKRAGDHYSQVTTGDLCDELDQLDAARTDDGAHAAPSWKVRTGAISGVLSARHPDEVGPALTSWDIHPETESPLPAIVAAARAATTGKDN